MRTTSQEMQARLDADATMFCHCWKVISRDGVKLGFTDHDRDLAFDATTFTARAGLDAASAETSLGFAIGGTEVSGALSTESLLEAELAAGRFDAANLETWLVDWSDPAQRMLLDVATIGEVRRTEYAFTAELRSLAHTLDQERGRRFQQACCADLGDVRCAVQLAVPVFQVSASVSRSGGPSECVAQLGAYAEGWFTGGTLQVTSGANASALVSIKGHRVSGADHTLSLWAPLASPFSSGDRFTLTAGCDKSFATCGGKFANIANFRGFPHIPGNDVLMSYPGQSDPVMDGGSLFR
ncbi:MAG: beta-tubulin [Hyphomicrobiales bacterium]|nr:beta-tubulin [Hyphomicrobiales bacterium]